ncbi:MAG: 50S ribosomal protein L25/general stress protein Ctc [Gammaproteobacteria bacterium]
MSDIFELEAKVRSDIGKGASRRLRRKADLIPAIIYGANQEPFLISLAHNKVIHALENEAFYSHILTLKIDGKTEQVILKDLQRHPYKRKILHMDFLRIKADEELIMNIPLHFINEDMCVGVKIEGGIISHLLNEVSISCLPTDLPEFIEVDMAECKLNDTIHLSSLKLPKGVELTAKLEEEEADLPIARVIMPRVAEEIETEAPEAGETEVTTEKAEEEKEEGKEKEATEKTKEEKKE